MYDNILAETLYVQKLYGEYISTVNRYQNLNRQSVFCRYLNINKEASTYGEVDSTFDHYNSGLQYDIYDYTPLFYSSQVLNEGAEVTDFAGQMFQGSLNVIIYSIETPRIEDLIVFNYSPQKSAEIFRVDHIRASINGMTSTPNANWFELTLDYAPIVDISKLNLLNHYVYSLPMQKYIFSKDFERMILETEKMVNLFKYLEKYNYDSKKELYYFIDEDNRHIAPLLENNILYHFLAMKNEYQDHFNNIPRPYGVFKYGIEGCLDLSLDMLISVSFPVFNFPSFILEQNEFVNIFQMVHLVRLWIWERNRDKFPEFKVPETIYPTIDNIYPSGLTAANTKCNPKIGLTVDVGSLPLNSYKR